MKNANPEAAQNLRELFEMELKDIYWVEQELTDAIPMVIDNTTSQDLKDALNHHLDETREQLNRLEQVFDILDIKAEAKKCEAMEGILNEAEEIMEDTKEGPIRDAGIISAVQKVEHYEIASYGTLRSFANILGESEVASLFEQTLNEEKKADSKLSELAETKINLKTI
ncbi:MAG: ferritin-like domain-containing protein [Bacteroidales bacterium]